jgi:hypothetical protein
MSGSNIGAKLYVAVDGSGDILPQNSSLNQAAYEALTWLQVGKVSNHGETGTTTNVLTDPTWDEDVEQQFAGTSNAGSPEVEVRRVGSDPGQIQMRIGAELSNRVNNYAFKIERLSGECRYNRGIILGSRVVNGEVEGLDHEIYQLGLNQVQIIVEAA